MAAKKNNSSKQMQEEMAWARWRASAPSFTSDKYKSKTSAPKSSGKATSSAVNPNSGLKPYKTGSTTTTSTVPKAPAKKAPAKKVTPAKKTAASSTTMRSTFGSKMEGPVSQRIRGAEWAYKSAQHKANNRAKAAKNPGGRIAKALAVKAAKEKTVTKPATGRKGTLSGRSKAK